MKLIKFIDVIGQAFFICRGIYLFLSFGHPLLSYEPPLSSYFFVGGWQVASFLIQLGYRGPSQSITVRKIYGFILLLVIVSGCLAFAGACLSYFEFLLLFSPFMALFYLLLSCFELVNMIKRSKDEELSTNNIDANTKSVL